ncbi:hypothetical protein ALC60_08268 [Trachymyrmex zeteki]|uniref:Aminopeptidase N-like N-terminal domain-containing protein n=1 Tax=Mycetomoellerius zeteki TaxID=64791 RepID=A0A151WY36_9HYME|nr:hypothetical protein ALC60_08268 [Trachymyrmex zeteki]
MAFSQLLLCSGFIFINILAYEHDLTVNDQIINLPNHIIPTYYNIVLSQNLNNMEIISYFDGICHIDITIHNVTQDIGFHAQAPSLFIDAHKIVLANTSKPDGFNILHTEFNYTYDHTNHIFNLHFLDMIHPGNYTLTLTFITYVHHDITHLRNDVQGLFSTTYINEDGNKT